MGTTFHCFLGFVTRLLIGAVYNLPTLSRKLQSLPNSPLSEAYARVVMRKFNASNVLTVNQIFQQAGLNQSIFYPQSGELQPASNSLPKAASLIMAMDKSREILVISGKESNGYFLPFSLGTLYESSMPVFDMVKRLEWYKNKLILPNAAVASTSLQQESQPPSNSPLFSDSQDVLED